MVTWHVWDTDGVSSIAVTSEPFAGEASPRYQTVQQIKADVVCSLLAFLTLNCEGHPALGEKVARASI